MHAGLLYLGDAQRHKVRSSEATRGHQRSLDAYLGDAQRHKVSIRMPPAEKVSHAHMADAVVKSTRDGLALTSPGCREQQACLGLDTPHQNP